MTRIPPHRWLAVVPALGILIGVPIANRMHASVLGLPFLLVWILGCVLLTSALMAVVGALDRGLESDARDAASDAPTDGRDA